MAAAPRKWRQKLELLAGLLIPTNAGVGKVLASDAEGNATWQLPGEASVASAYRKNAFGIPTNKATAIPVDTVVKDPGGRISLSKGAYVVPSEGYYAVLGNAWILTETVTTSLQVGSFILVNGTERVGGDFVEVAASASVVGAPVAGIVFCKKGDEIQLAAFQQDAAVEGERKTQEGGEARNLLCVMRVGEGPPGPEGKAGAWKALTLTGKLKAAPAEAGEPHGVRTESGEASARLRGEIEAKEEIKAAVTMLTIPAGFRPKKEITVLAARGTGAIPITITPAGACFPQVAIPKETLFNLDGITYNLT